MREGLTQEHRIDRYDDDVGLWLTVFSSSDRGLADRVWHARAEARPRPALRRYIDGEIAGLVDRALHEVTDG